MKTIIKTLIGLAMLAATAAFMSLAWWATSYGIEGTFALLVGMGITAYVYIEQRHKTIKERNLILRERIIHERT